MNVQIENLSACKRRLRIEVPRDDVQVTFDKVVAEMRREADLPGFRKGKAPIDLIKRRFHQQISKEVLERIITEKVSQALKDASIEPVGNPVLTEQPDLALSESGPTVDFRFEVDIEIHPEISLKRVRGLSLARKSAKVSSEEVKKSLEALRERVASLVPVEGRAARKGDFVAADVESERDDAKPKKETVTLSLDDNLEPTFLKELLDASPGDVKEFSVDYGAEHPDKTVAGKTVRYRVEVKAVKEKRLPELDDQFAKQISDELTSLAELEEQLRKDLEAQKQRDVRKDLEEQALAALIAENPVTIPETFIERQMRAQTEQAAQALGQRGIDPRDPSFNWKEIHESGREEALKRVHAALLLGKIADTEKIEVSEEEISREFERMAQVVGLPADEMRRHYKREKDAMENLRARLRRQKATDFLLAHATIALEPREPSPTGEAA
ncbi:MAG: trigger factor [Acidobacteriota bacterium]|nr:MAG: trigger factor [Acidobacteriota bacterium]